MIGTLRVSLVLGENPPANQPPAGPAVGNAAAEARARAAAQAALEEQQRRPVIEAMQARDLADGLRAVYEANNKPGPVPRQSKAAFDDMVAAYARAIERPLVSPEVADVVMYCHLRLSGALQYTQQFDEAIRRSKEAAKRFAGTPQEIQAVYTTGLLYLQAKHDPKEALPWLKQAREMAGAVAGDPQEQAKWLAATTQALNRCEVELKGKP